MATCPPDHGAAEDDLVGIDRNPPATLHLLPHLREGGTSVVTCQEHDPTVGGVPRRRRHVRAAGARLEASSWRQADVIFSASAPPARGWRSSLLALPPEGGAPTAHARSRGQLHATPDRSAWAARSSLRTRWGKRRLAEGEEGAPSRKDGAVRWQARHRGEEGSAHCAACRQRWRPEVDEPGR
jgi:hypothetical protein